VLVLQGTGVQHGQTEISVDDVRCHQWLINQIAEAPLHRRHDPHQHTSSICRWHIIWKASSVFMSATKRVYVRAELTLSVLGTGALWCWYWENCNSIPSVAVVTVVLWSTGAHLTKPGWSKPHTHSNSTNLALFRHKITLYRFNQGGSYYCRGLKWEQGLSPPWPPHFNHCSVENSWLNRQVQSCIEHPVGIVAIRTPLIAKVDEILYPFNWYIIYEDFRRRVTCTHVLEFCLGGR